jgi:phosphatidylinositol alpha-1,6-mannosyltransferase
MRHLLVTNDFPPLTGGIESMLWELWRRLDPTSFAVLTIGAKGDREWDATQPFRIDRVREPVLLPHPWLGRRIDALADELGASLVVLDPALPLGMIGPHLRHPYAVFLHGAEVTVPGRLPVTNLALRRVLRGARLVIAAGGYPLAEGVRAAGQPLPSVVIAPGVDPDRFHPLDAGQRAAARRRLGLPSDGRLVVSVSRLVPRKGMDVLVRAAAVLARTRPDLRVAIGGSGRDRPRLERLVRGARAPVRLLGRVPDDDLPGLYACADVFAMLCRDRWLGLEQEGFGIVFVEAAACGVPQVAGDSGGAAEAVVDGETGFVVRSPDRVDDVVAALAPLLDDEALRQRMGAASRARVLDELTYDRLAADLARALAGAQA